MLFGGIYAILVIRLALLCSQFFMSRKLEQDFRPKEAKPSVVNQQPDTFSNALLNTNIGQLANISLKRSVAAIFWMKAVSKFWRNAKASLIA